MQSIIARRLAIFISACGLFIPFKSLRVENGNKNFNSLLRNSTQEMNILLPVPEEIPNRSAL